MSVVSLEARIRKIEARCIEADPALKAMPDDEHALADWFQAGCRGSLPTGAFDSSQRSL